MTSPSAHDDGIDVVDAFFADTIAALRARLVPSNDNEEYRVYEDVVALLTDYRLADINAGAFEIMMMRMERGRAPMSMGASDAIAVAGVLRTRWAAYRCSRERR